MDTLRTRHRARRLRTDQIQGASSRCRRVGGSKHGVAGLLLEELLAWASTKGVAEVFLGTTDKFLAAHRFYQKNGFGDVPKTSLPEAFPVMAVDSKFYRRVLHRGGAVPPCASSS